MKTSLESIQNSIKKQESFFGKKKYVMEHFLYASLELAIDYLSDCLIDFFLRIVSKFL